MKNCFYNFISVTNVESLKMYVCMFKNQNIFLATHFSDIKFYILISIFLFHLIQFLIIKFNIINCFYNICNFKSEISRYLKLSERSNYLRLRFSWTIMYSFISD